MKVASYNMHKGIGLDRRRDPRRILDVLLEIDADVVALQECDRRFGARAMVIPQHLLADHSPWVPVPFDQHAVSMGWHGNAVLVRKDSAVAHCARVALPSLEPRGAVLAEIVRDVVPVRIVGMHLDLSGLWRRQQARAILRHVEARDSLLGHPVPTVMMGDLNEWTANAGCLRDFGRAFPSAPTGPSFHAHRPVGRLDRIMTRGFRIVDCGVHMSATARRASDHLPIWATLDLA